MSCGPLTKVPTEVASQMFVENKLLHKIEGLKQEFREDVKTHSQFFFVLFNLQKSLASNLITI